MIVLPRKIQRLAIVLFGGIVCVLFFYQFTKLFIDLATDNYVKTDLSQYRNSHYGQNRNFNKGKSNSINNVKYLLNEKEYNYLSQRTVNIPILYVSRHEGTISNFKYIGNALKWNLTVYSPEVFLL